MKPSLQVALLASLLYAPSLDACDLCAIYRAGDAKGETHDGFLVGVATQFIPYHTSQFESAKVQPTTSDFLDSTVTHVLLGYNFSPRFGLSLNTPISHFDFARTDLRYSASAPPRVESETGSVSGLGDMSLVGRFTLFQKRTMRWGVGVNWLVGVKLPTGESDRIADEIGQTQIYNRFLPPGTPHDPLGHSITGIHQHSLALGTGSVDAITGLTANANWQRWFFNAQFQYYLRTEGETGFKAGGESILSGGPGMFLLANPNRTLSLQGNFVHDVMARDEILGEPSNRTGSRASYAGPLVTFTWRSSFSINVGIDVPLQIANNGFQLVPNYRLHGGVSWTF